MTFYAALIDLLGRCAPEMHVSALGPKSNNPGLLLSESFLAGKDHSSIQNQ